jgi:hypothetical protein
MAHHAEAGPAGQRTSGSLEAVARTLVSVKVIAGAAVVLLSIGASYATTRAKVEQATPTLRHDSLVRAVAHQDTAVAKIGVDVNSLKRDIMGLNCLNSGYPSPFCDTIPRVRVMQAGSSRRLP